MNEVVVLDASAILAFLQGEPGEDIVRHALHDAACVVSAANHAEVIAKAIDRGIDFPIVERVLAELAYSVIDVKVEDGIQAGWLRDATRQVGLSLGDRLCLATAQRLKARVLTADRPWLIVAPALGIDIECIRPESH